MIISNDKAEQRLHNPMNLLNRLGELRNNKTKPNAMNLFGVSRSSNIKIEEIKPEIEDKDLTQTAQPSPPTFNPFKPNAEVSITPILKPLVPPTPANTPEPKLDDLLDNSDAKIRLAHAHDSALALLNDSVDALRLKLDDVSAEKLPGVITSASKVVESIRKERIELTKSNKDSGTTYNFYVPLQRKSEEFEVIDV